jgi:hypothetical protein
VSTVVEHSSGPGNRWVLPVLLALIIAAIILGAIFIPRLTKSSASPTATARVVVVTGSPTAGATTPVATATGTTSSVHGGSTPLPGATAVPTVPGLVLGMITHPSTEVSAAQSGADRKDPTYTFRLNPRQVVLQTLPREGFKSFSIASPAPSPSPTPHLGTDKRPVVKFIVSYQGADYTVSVAQPGKQGPGGVWFIVTVLPGQHLP